MRQVIKIMTIYGNTIYTLARLILKLSIYIYVYNINCEIYCIIINDTIH